MSAPDLDKSPVGPVAHGPVAPGRSIGFLLPVAYWVRYGFLSLAVALTLVAEGVGLAQRGMQWRGDLLWTLDWLPVSFILVAPVVTGFAALDASRASVGAAHMFQNRVTRTPFFAVFMAYAVLISAAHLLIVAVALAISRPVIGDRWAPLAVLCHLFILSFFVALGTLLGRFVRPILAGVSGALAALAMMYMLSAPSKKFSVLEYGGATVPRVGYAYNAEFLGIQAAVLLVLIVGMMTVRPSGGSGWLRIRYLDVGVAGLAVATLAASSMLIGVDRLKPVEVTPDFCGAVETVPVCYYRQHKRVAESFDEGLFMLFDAARRKGYDSLIPASVAEASRTTLPAEKNPEAAAIFVMPEHLSGTAPTLQELALGILQPLHCAQVRGELPPRQQYFDDLQALIGTWAELAVQGGAEQSGYTGPILTAEQAGKMAQEFRTCTYAFS